MFWLTCYAAKMIWANKTYRICIDFLELVREAERKIYQHFHYKRNEKSCLYELIRGKTTVTYLDLGTSKLDNIQQSDEVQSVFEEIIYNKIFHF